MRDHPICWQTYAVAAMCLADLATTIWLCRVHGAAEANPMMAFFLSQGVVVFALSKVIFTAAPLALLEWARRVQPKVAIIALNTSLLGYLTLYAAGVAHVNRQPSTVEAERRINADPAYAAPLAEINRRVAEKRRTITASRSRKAMPSLTSDTDVRNRHTLPALN